jgi:putative flippase GtrA
LINGLTFAVDLMILTGLHSGLRLPVPIAVTAAYACAFTLSYVLNRAFNFQSHAPVGPQVAIYVIVFVVNYLAFILGVTTVLAAVGVYYQLSRIVAGICEAVYMYCAMRWVVFRR